MTSSLSEQLASHFSGSEWPGVSDVAVADGEASLTLEIDPGIRWFDGHFPDNPVLPGVMQVHWAVEFARYLFAVEGVFEKVENLKFKSVVLPEMTVTLRLVNDQEKGMIRFSYSSADAVHSEGRMTFS